MPPPHNWWVRLRLMHTPLCFLFIFFVGASLAKTNPPFPQPHYCIVTAPESPWQQTCATARPPLSHPLPSTTTQRFFLTKKPGELESTNMQHLPQWSAAVHAADGKKVIFQNNLSAEKSLLVQLVAIGNCISTWSKEQQAWQASWK